MTLIHVVVYQESDVSQLSIEEIVVALNQRLGLLLRLVPALESPGNMPTDAMSIPPDSGSSQATTSDVSIDETIQGERISVSLPFTADPHSFHPLPRSVASSTIIGFHYTKRSFLRSVGGTCGGIMYLTPASTTSVI